MIVGLFRRFLRFRVFFANFLQDILHETLHLALIRAYLAPHRVHIAPHLRNLLTHCIVFCVVSLLQHLAFIINLASQIICNLLDLLANICKLAFDQAVGIVNFASPRVRLAVDSLFISTAVRLNDVQEYF